MFGKLHEMGYEDIETMNFPSIIRDFDIDTTDWYCVIARKS